MVHLRIVVPSYQAENAMQLLPSVCNLIYLERAARRPVLISVTTIPAAANIGVAAALGDGEEWLGAMEQLSLNLGAIFLACIGTLYLQRLLYLRRRREHLHSEAREAAGLPLGRSRRARSPDAEDTVPPG